MHFVYILRSQKNTDRFYIGVTNSINRRLKEHAIAKGGSYTVHHAPWQLETYIALSSQKLAEELEKYLKSHSGRAFLRRRLMAR